MCVCLCARAWSMYLYVCMWGEETYIFFFTLFILYFQSTATILLQMVFVIFMLMFSSYDINLFETKFMHKFRCKRKNEDENKNQVLAQTTRTPKNQKNKQTNIYKKKECNTSFEHYWLLNIILVELSHRHVEWWRFFETGKRKICRPSDRSRVHAHSISPWA